VNKQTGWHHPARNININHRGAIISMAGIAPPAIVFARGGCCAPLRAFIARRWQTKQKLWTPKMEQAAAYGISRRQSSNSGEKRVGVKQTLRIRGWRACLSYAQRRAHKHQARRSAWHHLQARSVKAWARWCVSLSAHRHRTAKRNARRTVKHRAKGGEYQQSGRRKRGGGTPPGIAVAPHTSAAGVKQSVKTSKADENAKS